MKKFVGIAVMAALIAGAATAQGLKFDGYLNGGLGVVSVGDNDVILKPFGVDSEQNGYRFRLNGSYQNEAKNAGVRFRFQSQSNLSTAGYLSLPYVYGWVSFFDNAINLTGGIVDDSTWTPADWWISDDVGEGLGLLLKLKPIKGLNLGAGAYVISQQGGGSNNILSTYTTLPNFGTVTPSLEDAKYVFSGSYTLADVFRLGATFRTENKAGWAPIVGAGYPYNGRQESSQLVGELRLLAVKNLTAIAAASLDNLQDFDEKGNIVLSETFAYKINSDINAGLDMVQFFYNRTNDVDPSLLFHLWGSYALGNIVPRLDLTYFIGGRSSTSQQYHRKGFVNSATGVPNTDDDYSVFSLRPSVKINLDSRTFLEIGDVLNFNSANFNVSGWGNEKSQLTNVFYVDLKWSF